MRMLSKLSLSSLGWTIVFILLASLEINGKPTIDSIALLDADQMKCTPETTHVCQKCAKNTKSAVVYPWCCANHEGVRDWCEHYLHFGLP